jgi:hypothetical protein
LGAGRLDGEPFSLPGRCVVVFYRWRNQQPWTFFLFIFVLIAPTILYLASLLLFPREGAVDQSIQYKTHFYANHRAFFILFALFIPVDIADTLLKGVPHFLGQGPQYIARSALYLTGLTTAAITRNERYHQFYAIFFSCRPSLSASLFFTRLCKRKGRTLSVACE